ncbi:nucleotidyltransferase domain-containing protein [Clostridium sp. CMCC3677]|uniref:nucleotidyltransferase domain-containing protein n=1 Tax=Clostridium sp. CMCC3677 TaxID=2949963 RepID=UPI0013F0B065|nr:nucleotidyltransferase domain-containing protein [Clostridium sp. CMCC3677]NFG60736.1 nucleotidyltransferase domain-containing protein [Clostridium botulinum]NFQ08170.1 nucleotidyltransferase domain-containing protein [Clostridium botulinum]
MNVNSFNKEIDYIKKQVIEKFNPKEIILFGSVAKGIFREDSDIDLCIIKDTINKRELLTNMYVNIESNIPFDLVLYTNEEWNNCINDKSSFAYSIINTGVKIYG